MIFKVVLFFNFIMFSNLIFAENQHDRQIDAILSLYWSQPSESAYGGIQEFTKNNKISPEAHIQIEKVKVHWKIQNLLENCVLKDEKNQLLKKRILGGVQGADEEFMLARQALGDEQDLQDFKKLCISHECPNGALELVQKNSQR